MRYFNAFLGAAIAAASFATPSQADVVSMAGDADCFGLGGTCKVGDLWRDDLGGSFFSDYSTASDPAFTDRWNAFPSISFTLAGGAGSGFSLSLFIAGIADGSIRGPYTVLFNGTPIGAIDDSGNANAFQEVALYTFGVADGLVLASNTISFDTSAVGDGYIIDYGVLTVRTAEGAVPEPASWALMIGGFGLAGGVMRRRRTMVSFA